MFQGSRSLLDGSKETRKCRAAFAHALHVIQFDVEHAEANSGSTHQPTDAYAALRLSVVEEAAAVTLLWDGRSELRLWGPEEVLAMDAAYGVSAMIPVPCR
jgi:hypothetical protein